MVLIKNWRNAPKMLSVQVAMLAAMADVLSEYMPMLQYYWPDGITKWVCLLVIVARLINQGVRDD